MGEVQYEDEEQSGRSYTWRPGSRDPPPSTEWSPGIGANPFPPCGKFAFDFLAALRLGCISQYKRFAARRPGPQGISGEANEALAWGSASRSPFSAAGAPARHDSFSVEVEITKLTAPRSFFMVPCGRQAAALAKGAR